MYFSRRKYRKGDGKNIGFLQRHMFQEYYEPSPTIFHEKRDRNARQEEVPALL